MGTVEIINSRLTRITSNWDESERERVEKIDIENKKMIANINAFKSSVTVKFNILQSGTHTSTYPVLIVLNYYHYY
jgi:hypothetical protein